MEAPGPVAGPLSLAASIFLAPLLGAVRQCHMWSLPMDKTEAWLLSRCYTHLCSGSTGHKSYGQTSSVIPLLFSGVKFLASWVIIPSETHGCNTDQKVTGSNGKLLLLPE
jgi:hypothetical protein